MRGFASWLQCSLVGKEFQEVIDSPSGFVLFKAYLQERKDGDLLKVREVEQRAYMISLLRVLTNVQCNKIRKPKTPFEDVAMSLMPESWKENEGDKAAIEAANNPEYWPNF